MYHAHYYYLLLLLLLCCYDCYYLLTNSPRPLLLPRYRGKNGITAKKQVLVVEDIEARKPKIDGCKRANAALEARAAALRTALAAEQKLLREAEAAVADRDRKTETLARRAVELGKFKGVLEHKVGVLRTQIEPRDAEISALKDQAKQLDDKLESYHVANSRMDAEIGELRTSMDAMQKVVGAQRSKRASNDRLLVRFRKGIDAAAQLLLKPALLKKHVEAMHAQLVGPDLPPVAEASPQVESELNKQAESLKATMQGLQAQFEAAAKAHQKENRRLVAENMVLVNVSNRLRAEVVGLKTNVVAPVARATAVVLREEDEVDPGVLIEDMDLRIAQLREEILDTQERVLRGAQDGEEDASAGDDTRTVDEADPASKAPFLTSLA